MVVEVDAEEDEPQIRRLPFSARIDERILERLEAASNTMPRRRSRSKQNIAERALDAYLRALGY